MSAPALDGKAALRGLLVPLVKLALAGEGGVAGEWRREVLAAQRQVAAAPGGLAALRLDDLWAASVKAAERDPAVRRDETVNPTLSTTSPLRLDQLDADPFDLDGAVRAIRDAASFG